MEKTTMTSPRISFSGEFLDDESFISISPRSSLDDETEREIERELESAAKNSINITGSVNADFEFLSTKNSIDAGATHTMLTADELFSDGKLLPYKNILTHATEKLSKINLKSDSNESKESSKDDVQHVSANVLLSGREQPEPRIWFVDDDPSPRPPKCTVLFKELLRLKKQKSSSLSHSTSSSSSSSSSSFSSSSSLEKEKEKKRTKKVLERTRSASSSIRIRPMVNVPICTQGKSTSLPPLFPLRNKSKIDR